MHISLFHPIPDNIMHTLQTLSVNEWGHNVGCLGKFATSGISVWSTLLLSACIFLKEMLFFVMLPLSLFCIIFALICQAKRLK